jgi:hypothetical protein
MIDTTTIHTDLIALIGRDTQLKRVAATNGGEYAGPCPFCGGKDRFRVWPHTDHPGWWCRQCARRGDAIGYLMQRDNLDFRAACDRLGATRPALMSPRYIPIPPLVDPGVPTADWQTRASRIVDDCEAALWSEAGAKARGWLAARGLWEETLLSWRIGYCPKDGKYHDLYLDRGIVIPWLVDDTIWKLNVRRPVGEPKYRALKGSYSVNALFGADHLAGYHDCIITEGEFDAMLIWQELGDLADVLTLGSANGRVADRWLPTLLRFGRFWVATDNDVEGEKAAQYWLTLTSERGRRLLPPNGAKDVTEAWQAGTDLRAWAMTILER